MVLPSFYFCLVLSGNLVSSRLLTGDNKNLSVLKAIMNIRKAIHWVPTIQGGLVSLQVGELVKSGQHNNLMSILLGRNWESATTAGIQIEILEEFGATLPTKIN